jgi:hypothetical protein
MNNLASNFKSNPGNSQNFQDFRPQSVLSNCVKLGGKREAARILGISPETLKKYRLQEGSSLISGIHYHVWNSRTIRYNLELLADWGLNRNSPEVHQRTIELYLASLVTNQNKRGKRSQPPA